MYIRDSQAPYSDTSAFAREIIPNVGRGNSNPDPNPLFPFHQLPRFFSSYTRCPQARRGIREYLKTPLNLRDIPKSVSSHIFPRSYITTITIAMNPSSNSEYQMPYLNEHLLDNIFFSSADLNLHLRICSPPLSPPAQHNSL